MVQHAIEGNYNFWIRGQESFTAEKGKEKIMLAILLASRLFSAIRPISNIRKDKVGAEQLYE